MKTCAASNCHYPVFSNLYCKAHQYMRKDDKYDRRTALQKHFDKQRKEPTPYVKSIIEKVEAEELKGWFKMVAQEIKKHPYCMECGVFIPERYYRHASAHIVSKSIFKSVATNENNFLILGASCGCHHKFDNGGMQEMNVFEEAVRRYSLFVDQIKERHKHLEIFNQLL